MNRKLIGFAIIVFSLVSMGTWEFWGREHLYYETILVLKEPLEAHRIVGEEDLETKKVELPSKNALKLKDKQKLIGMETAQYVADDTELREEYFCQSKYQVGEDTGKGTLAISHDWLLSYPQSLMRGDNIALYNGNTKVGECIVSHVRDSSNNEISFSKDSRQTSSGTAIHLEVISDISTLLEISKIAAGGARFALINLE